MIKVFVELWPNGNEAEKETIAEAVIVNDRRGDQYWGNYYFELSCNDKKFTEGKVFRHQRGRCVWELIWKVMRSAFAYEEAIGQ
ncbi:MAG: hypothetical protein AB2L14_25420 [Candidatus Xenobiia bacterium LiM19]